MGRDQGLERKTGSFIIKNRTAYSARHRGHTEQLRGDETCQTDQLSENFGELGLRRMAALRGQRQDSGGESRDGGVGRRIVIEKPGVGCVIR